MKTLRKENGHIPYHNLFISTCYGPGVSDHSAFPFQANLKKFMEYVQQRSVEKVCRFLEKGLDPNFHDVETGGEDVVQFFFLIQDYKPFIDVFF